MNANWPKVIHAIELENRLADEIQIELQTFAHGTQGGEVLKIVVTRKGEAVGIITPNKLELH
jgi:hypothetical protein